jgi:hypothetical protein
VKEGVRMLEEGIHEIELGNGAVLKVCDLLSIPSVILHLCLCAIWQRIPYCSKEELHIRHVGRMFV